jgi:hypothetical protein
MQHYVWSRANVGQTDCLSELCLSPELHFVCVALQERDADSNLDLDSNARMSG